MDGKTDAAKGRIEEAVGASVGNDRFRAEGRADQLVGTVEQGAAKTIDKAKKTVKSRRV